MNTTIGQLWLDMAQGHTAFHGVRVESKANLADGPTRKSFFELERLEATFVAPVLPTWVFDLWRFPVHQGGV